MTNTKTHAAEWISGSAYDFLELSPEETAYVELKLKLAKALKKYRMAKPLSQIALAKRLKTSQSRVAKMESGDPSVTIDLLLRSLILLGVRKDEIARVLVFDEAKHGKLNNRTVDVGEVNPEPKPAKKGVTKAVLIGAKK